MWRLGWMLVAMGMLVVAGCETGPVRPIYVPATNYDSLNCDALRVEYSRIDASLKNGVETHKNLFSGIGFGLGAVGGSGGGWGIIPSISIGGGQSSESPRTAYAQLLGQRDAVAQQARFKGCPIEKLSTVSQSVAS